MEQVGTVYDFHELFIYDLSIFPIGFSATLTKTPKLFDILTSRHATKTECRLLVIEVEQSEGKARKVNALAK
jgi:hypothetical protein